MNERYETDFYGNPNYAAVFDEIIREKNLSDVEKLKKMFGYVTSNVTKHSQHEIELLQAMGDQEGVVKEQIKIGTLNMSRGMFEFCYRHLTGDRRRSVWDE